ncbi:MAG: hypothetical protein LRY43_02530 [Gammaproteobacteria bacterium]|nr:hypothetical protein [Gammaproteobacteria bacterium]
MTHAQLIAEERQRANRENRKPQFIPLLHQWGGVTIVYRQRMQQSPAYVNNHEELHKALEEGIFYSEHLSPVRVNLDEHGHCHSMACTTQEKLFGDVACKKHFSGHRSVVECCLFV